LPERASGIIYKKTLRTPGCADPRPEPAGWTASEGVATTPKPMPYSGGKAMSQPHDAMQGDPCVAAKDRVQKPRLFRVLLHNDNYTTMEFVVMVLMDVFHKSQEEASDIMFSVHERGIGICGVYPREIAEFRVNLVTKRARQAGFPLLCTMEEE
jgi:ATP-dependent Clp protease adaptor protein ClpS